MKKLLIAIVCAGVLLGTNLNLLAADKPAEKKPAVKKEQAAKTRPFNGVIKAVDQSAKTITLEGEKAQTFSVTSETKIMKAGKPATLADLAVGDKVGGRAKETADGKWEALTINAGTKAVKSEGTKPKPEEKKK